MKTGIATFTLDYGTCPRWLFERMVKLGRAMTEIIILEYGPEEYIRRLADPVWFQSLGTVLAFDWNASGLTTILTAALKEGIRGREKELGVFICGGKGKTSRKTPDQILDWGNKLGFEENKANQLIYNSKMAAKVDSSLIQDGFQLYHHSFFFTRNGAWTVVQQGMNLQKQTARRYHWYSQNFKDFVNEPHAGVVSDLRLKPLNLVANASSGTRSLSIELVNGGFDTLMKDLKLLEKYSSSPKKILNQNLILNNTGQPSDQDSQDLQYSKSEQELSENSKASQQNFKILNKFSTPMSQMVEIETGYRQLKLLNLENMEFKTHPVVAENFYSSKVVQKIFAQLCDQKPENYEKLVASVGVGPKTVRALALVGEVLYGAKPSYQDPARYSFAHGGKDATPYPVDKKTYDQSIFIMKKLVEKISIDYSEKKKILNRLDHKISKNL